MGTKISIIYDGCPTPEKFLTIHHYSLTLESRHPRVTRQFKFELGWLLRDGFIEMIKELWTNTNVECSRMEIW
jgi:hypothetical protein